MQAANDLRNALNRGAVHIWCCHYNKINAADLALYETKLPTHELAQANAYYFQNDRTRFIVTRTLLRFLLTQYTGQSFEKITFDHTADGKPFLVQNTASKSIQFNLSHTQFMIAIAIAYQHDIGIDIESQHHPVFDQGKPKAYLSEGEQQEAAQLNTEQWLAFCIERWTAKEALLKAIGCGLRIAPNQISTSTVAIGQLMVYLPNPPLDHPRPQPAYYGHQYRIDECYIIAFFTQSLAVKTEDVTLFHTIPFRLDGHMPAHYLRSLQAL